MQKTFVMPAKMFRYHTFFTMLAVAKMFRYHERITPALLIREPLCEVAVTLWNTAKMFRYACKNVSLSLLYLHAQNPQNT